MSQATATPPKRLTPLLPLDDPTLANGPYSDEQFQTGHISTRDLGALYGYIYRPVRFTGDESKVVGTSTRHPCTKDDKGRVQFGDKFPWCTTEAEAIKFLQDHGYYGHVQRYCLNERVLRDEWEDVIIIAGWDSTHRKVEPWCTAGVVAVVNAPDPKQFHAHLLAVKDIKTVHVREPSFVSRTD